MLFGTAGRIRRRDYWVWMFANTFVMAILLGVAVAGVEQLHLDEDHRSFLGVCVMVVNIALFVGINLCLTVKRWHDRNRPGYMYLIMFIPFFGWTLGLVWTFIECGFVDGTQGPNRFGKLPKGIAFATGDMRFRDMVVFKAQGFKLGIETHSRQYYLSIPVTTHMVKYEEFYRLDKAQFESFKNDVGLGSAFADRCGDGEMDHLLFIPAGSRGLA